MPVSPPIRIPTNGEIKSDRVTLRFNEVNPINKAFLMMVRQEKFDVSEMAIATSAGQGLRRAADADPAPMMGRFQHGTMFYNSERRHPENLEGRRIGVRAFSQTTGVWKDYGVDLGKAKWVTFEDAHIAEYRDPPWSARLPGEDITKMVLDGELDAAISAAISRQTRG